MKRLAGIALVLTLAFTLVHGRETKETGVRPMQAVIEGEYDLFEIDQGLRGRLTAAQVDTYCIVWYDFESMNWQGWTRVDNTAEIDTFFHVDDFSGLDGGDHGLLYPIEGTKSMWCGTRPGDDDYLCSWGSAPGYGNGWEQFLVTKDFPFSGAVTLSYHGVFDSEPDFDVTSVQYDAGNGDWREITGYDGTKDTIAVHTLQLAQASTKFRFYFEADGAWSDQDGLYNSDGAAIIDSITVADAGGVIDFEDFESWPLFAESKEGALWRGGIEEGFGLYSGPIAGIAVDKDPCGDNFSTQIVFFIGSPYPSSDYPGLYETPYCKGPGSIEAPCQEEYVMSPVIDMTKYSTNCDEIQDAAIPPEKLGDLGGCYFRFTVYRDLPVANLVFYNWAVRNYDEEMCPEQWQDRSYAYYGDDLDYIFSLQDVSDLVGDDPIQIRLGCIDMCDVWYQVYGNCAAHTPSPWFDNVRIQRFDVSGPQWSWRDLDIFQDNFPEAEFHLESYIRADCANDLRANDDPVIDPGDSAVVTCASPLGGGIDTTADGWPKVYCHVYPQYIGDPLSPKPTLYGPALAGTYGRYDSDDGSTWTILQCEYARTGAGNIAPDKFAIDMNDSLFTRGYRVNYYFKAYDFAGTSTTLPWYAGEGVYFEWTCLPTLASDILFIDDYHGRGTLSGTVQQYWDPSFRAVLPSDNLPDRYDVNNPSSLVSNGPGSRAKNFHLTTAYHKIIWDSGNLDAGTITEGTSYSDKSDDAQMLVDWMEFSPHDVGLWVCGDEVARDLNGSPAPVALELMSSYCGVGLNDDSYYSLSGIVSPLLFADANTGNCLWHTTWGDSFNLFGGCPIINGFDVLDKTAGGEYALRYPDIDDDPYYAGIYSVGINDGGYDIRTMWFGFSMMYMRETDPALPMMRNQVVRDIISWMENDVNSDITETDKTPAVNALSQNYPNPFNPVTTIKFGLRSKGRVSIRIYDVAGRLVRTLVDGVLGAGPHEVTWNGTNDRAAKVASGVYFYRMRTAEFERTKKMVLLR